MRVIKIDVTLLKLTETLTQTMRKKKKKNILLQKMDKNLTLKCKDCLLRLIGAELLNHTCNT